MFFLNNQANLVLQEQKKRKALKEKVERIDKEVWDLYGMVGHLEVAMNERMDSLERLEERVAASEAQVEELEEQLTAAEARVEATHCHCQCNGGVQEDDRTEPIAMSSDVESSAETVVSIGYFNPRDSLRRRIEWCRGRLYNHPYMMQATGSGPY